MALDRVASQRFCCKLKSIDKLMMASVDGSSAEVRPRYAETPTFRRKWVRLEEDHSWPRGCALAPVRVAGAEPIPRRPVVEPHSDHCLCEEHSQSLRRGRFLGVE